MRVIVAYNRVSDPDSPDDADVLIQAAAVSAALRRLGHEAAEIPCTLDLAALERELRRNPPDVVFNLVESLEGHARLIHAVPFLLESMGIPFTGSNAEAVLLTSHKVLAKQRMDAVGLPTPRWAAPLSRGPGAAGAPPAGEGEGEGSGPAPPGWLVKPVWEHASVGLDEADTVLSLSLAGARVTMARDGSRFGHAFFAEQFVEGREFNLSLLAGENGPQVLPPAEIVFDSYPEGKLRIVGYRAKWDPDSFEYAHTPRRFDFPPADRRLIERLAGLARDCWGVFDLGGYARVDFRVDGGGRPWILEVNANPCLSPDAGFAAALAEAGIDFDDAVEAILEDALR